MMAAPPTGSGAAFEDDEELVAELESGAVEGDDSDRRSVGSSGPSLHRSSEAAQLRAMRLQQELLLREAEECTFHPRTNGGARPVSKATQPDAFFTRSQQWAAQVAEAQEELSSAASGATGGTPQAVVVSGESGAGKTETNKCTLACNGR